MSNPRLLKKDLFGEVWLVNTGPQPSILRDTRTARWWLRWLARWLLKREADGLAALDGLDGVPALIHYDKERLSRSYLGGSPLHVGKPADKSYFVSAARLLRRMHRAGVAHNDLAKEPNLLLCDDGTRRVHRFPARHAFEKEEPLVSGRGARGHSTPAKAQAHLLPG